MLGIVAAVVGFFTPAAQVNRALGSFTKAAKKLDGAVYRAGTLVTKSYARHDRAYSRFDAVSVREADKRIALWDVMSKAVNVRSKLNELIGA